MNKRQKKKRLKNLQEAAKEREARQPELAEANEIGTSTGVLNTYGDTDQQFSKENECPYFLEKSELCFLDGRICLYDTATFPVCRRYKAGAERRLPGPDGETPTVPPISSLRALRGDVPGDPFVDPNKTLYKN